VREAPIKAVKSPTPAKNSGKSGANAKGLTKLTYPSEPVNSTAKLLRIATRIAWLIRLRSERVEIVYYPARPLLTSTLTFARRFSARPDADSLLAMGLVLPIAPGATMCRTGMLQFSVR
jgi:hypothetical protein